MRGNLAIFEKIQNTDEYKSDIFVLMYAYKEIKNISKGKIKNYALDG